MAEKKLTKKEFVDLAKRREEVKKLKKEIREQLEMQADFDSQCMRFDRKDRIYKKARMII